MTEDETIALVREAIRTHSNDDGAHELSGLRRRLAIAESKTGLWTVAAADSFDGSGPLTKTDVGGLSWNAIGGAQLERMNGVAQSPDGALRGTVVSAGVADGQVEATLAPGNGQAALYLRFVEPGNYFLLGRLPGGFIGLYRFLNGPSSLALPPVYRQFAPGERFKARMVGDRIWVFRVASGAEELIFDLTDAHFRTAGTHGIRVSGTGSVDDFRILKREAL